MVLDVVPFDPKGQTVAGLTENDFEISEKVGWITTVPGKIVAIRSVDKAGQMVTGRPPSFLQIPPRWRGENPPEPPLTVLLIDGINSDLSSTYAKQQMARMADTTCTTAPADGICGHVPVAVLLLGKKLEMLQEFSTDLNTLRQTLRGAFDEKKSTAGAAAPENVPRGPVVSTSANAATLPSVIHDWDRVPKAWGEDSRRVQMTMDALRAIARRLAGYPGRKSLIWVSSAFPFSIVPDPGTSNADDAAGYRSQTIAVMNALSNARVALYPARVFLPAVIAGDPKNPQVAASNSKPAVPGPALDKTPDLVMTGTLEEFAALTGGRTCVNVSGLAQCLNAILHDAPFVYEIGYYPSAQSGYEGFHRMTVKLKRHGLTLAYRRYYYVQNRKPTGSDFEMKQAACDDLMTATGLSVTVEPVPDKPGRFSLEVDGRELTAAAVAENSSRLRLNLNVAVCSFNAQGKPLQHVQFHARPEMNAEEFKVLQQSGFHSGLDFQPVPAATFMRWVVRDAQTGELGSVEVPYQAAASVADAGDGKNGGTAAEQVNSEHRATEPAASAALPALTGPPSDMPQPATQPPAQSAAQPAAQLPVQPPPQPVAAAAAVQTSVLDPEAEVAPYCTTISSVTDHAAPLADLCKFAISLARKMPNVICDRETKRHWRLNGSPHSDVVTATVTYGNGQENYSNIQINGKQATSTSRELNSSWSMGELATILQMMFAPASDTEFHFLKEEKLHSTPVLVYDFRVDETANVMFFLHAFFPGQDYSYFPAYRGKIWIDPSNSKLVRLERETADVPKWFPITRVSTTIDYADVPLGDGTNFTLPIKAEVESCSRDEQAECAHNLVTFNRWHKFGSKSRIISLEDVH